MSPFVFQLKTAYHPEEWEGLFYVIETFPYPQFVMNENGEVKTFDDYNDAAEEAADCQNGYVLVF